MFQRCRRKKDCESKKSSASKTSKGQEQSQENETEKSLFPASREEVWGVKVEDRTNRDPGFTGRITVVTTAGMEQTRPLTGHFSVLILRGTGSNRHHNFRIVTITTPHFWSSGFRGEKLFVLPIFFTVVSLISNTFGWGLKVGGLWSWERVWPISDSKKVA